MLFSMRLYSVVSDLHIAVKLYWAAKNSVPLLKENVPYMCLSSSSNYLFHVFLCTSFEPMQLQVVISHQQSL